MALSPKGAAGIMVSGVPGSGKTAVVQLCLAAWKKAGADVRVADAKDAGDFAAFGDVVGDDQGAAVELFREVAAEMRARLDAGKAVGQPNWWDRDPASWDARHHDSSGPLGGQGHRCVIIVYADLDCVICRSRLRDPGQLIQGVGLRPRRDNTAPHLPRSWSIQAHPVETRVRSHNVQSPLNSIQTRPREDTRTYFYEDATAIFPDVPYAWGIEHDLLTSYGVGLTPGDKPSGFERRHESS